jgi:hypothetical protein
MTTPTRVSIAALPRGHEFPEVPFTISKQQAEAYVSAVGDASGYSECVPPLAPVALALASLQEWVFLPDGTLHVGQEVEHNSPISAGQELTLAARVAQRSERQGFVISVIEMDVLASGTSAIRTRATVMAPGDAA